jgi:hypothetical protein
MPVHHIKDVDKDMIAEHGVTVVYDITGVNEHWRPADV